MANRLTSLIALMILSAIFLVQFQFDLDGTAASDETSTNNAWKGASVVEKRCKGKLSGSDVQDCQIMSQQGFCQVDTIVAAQAGGNAAAADNSHLTVPFQCLGDEYTQFGTALHSFADNIAEHGDSWGRRAYGLPSHRNILMLGNADTAQVAHSLACQHANAENKISSVAAPIDERKTAQKITFGNNSTLVLLTDDKIADAAEDAAKFAAAVAAETGMSLDEFDGMIWGLLHDCGAVAANCRNTTQPAFDTALAVFSGPMLFISMMADARSEQAMAMRDVIREKRDLGHKNLWFISGRRYISKIKLEGATIYGNGDADNVPKTGRYGHRCTGSAGGHADLLAFDVTEFLYHQLFYKSGKTS